LEGRGVGRGRGGGRGRERVRQVVDVEVNNHKVKGNVPAILQLFPRLAPPLYPIEGSGGEYHSFQPLFF
jgi:hypothetical protein